jgi:hypothetical protein
VLEAAPQPSHVRELALALVRLLESLEAEPADAATA